MRHFVYSSRLLIILLFCFSQIMQAVERPMSIREINQSWDLYLTLKYADFNDDQKQLKSRIERYLNCGARPNILYEKNTTAISLAEQKKFTEIVVLMNRKIISEQDALHQVWNELEKRGILKKSQL